MKKDITKDMFYVKKMFNVVKAHHSNIRKYRRIEHRDFDAFTYVLSGGCTYRFDDGCEFTAKKGDIIYISSSEKYTAYISEPGYRFIYCDFLFDSSEDRKSGIWSPQNEVYAETVFRKLLSCYSAPSKAALCECVSLLYEIYGIILTTANRNYTSQSVRSKISDVKEFIETSYKDTSLSVASLAERAGISEVYLRKLFKAQFNISPSQYILSVRLKKARELMKYPFLSLEDCALQSGFSSLQYFCRVFKKATGVTPNNYRKS